MKVYLKDVPLGTSIKAPDFFPSDPEYVVEVIAVDGSMTLMLGSKISPKTNNGYLFKLDISKASRKDLHDKLGVSRTSKVVDDIFEYKYFAGWFSGMHFVELIKKLVDQNKKCSTCSFPIPHSEIAQCEFCIVYGTLN